MIIINNQIEFDQIIELIQKSTCTIEHSNDYYTMWKNKIIFLEKYYKENYNILDYDFYFFKGISNISLRLIKSVGASYLTYGPSINRFYDIKNKYDLCYNSKYGPIVNTISEYIKYEYFNNRRVDFNKIFILNLSNNDYYYLISRLLFPTYYFDLLKDNNIINNYEKIINYLEEYLLYIKEIIIEIKKRHKDMTFLDYIINLF